MTSKNGSRKPKLALGLAALGGAAIAGAFAFDLPPWAQRMAQDWGPGFVILAGLAAGVVRYVPPEAIGKFVLAQQDTAVALSGIKDSLVVMTGQSGKLDELKNMMDEVLLHQRINGDRLKAIEARVGDVRRDDDT